MSYKIVLPGPPIPQKRSRIFAKGAMDPCWSAKQQHKEYILLKYPDIKTLDGALEVKLKFYSTFPKSMSKKRRPTAQKTTRPDLDNLVKYVLDMGNELLWKDDSFIVSFWAYKAYDEEERTEIEVKEFIGDL